MRKLFYYLGYLAFFGSGCFSTSSILDEHPEKKPTFFNQVKETFMKEINIIDKLNNARDLITGISGVIYNDNEQRRAALLSGTVTATATSGVIIGTTIAVLHAPQLLLIGIPAAALYSLISIYNSGQVTIGRAVGKGLAMGLITGTTSVISTETSQLLGHLSHNLDHTTPVHLSHNSDHTTPVHLSHNSDHTTPVHHSGDSSLTPKSDVKALEDFKKAINAIKKVDKDHSLKNMSTDLHNAEVYAEKAVNEAENPNIISKEESGLNLDNMRKAISNAHPEDPSHDGLNFSMVPQGNGTYVVAPGHNSWEQSCSNKEIHRLDGLTKEIEKNLHHMHNGSKDTAHNAASRAAVKAPGDTAGKAEESIFSDSSQKIENAVIKGEESIFSDSSQKIENAVIKAKVPSLNIEDPNFAQLSSSSKSLHTLLTSDGTFHPTNSAFHAIKAPKKPTFSSSIEYFASLRKPFDEIQGAKAEAEEALNKLSIDVNNQTLLTNHQRMMQQTIAQMKNILDNFKKDLNETLLNNDLSDPLKDDLTESKKIADTNKLLPAGVKPLELHLYRTADDFHKQMQTKYSSAIEDLEYLSRVSDAISQNDGQNITEIIKSALKHNENSVFKGFYEEELSESLDPTKAT